MKKPLYGDFKEESKMARPEQQKMNRPWERKEYAPDRLVALFGPEVAPDGTTRNDFFDMLRNYGWNYPGDEATISHLYVKVSIYLQTEGADMDLVKNFYRDMRSGVKG